MATEYASAKTWRWSHTMDKTINSTGSIRASKNEAMRQIHSETQRLLRETGISLPYHRPKQRTLQEFLNRKKILTSLPKAPSTAAKLKMSSVIVSRVVAEKEKEAELFYKSSDSEDDTQQSISFAAKDRVESSTTYKKIPLIDVNDTCIQNFKETDTSNQVIHNKEKVIQDSTHLDTIVSEKDFNKVDYQNRESSLLNENNNNHDDGSNISSQQIDKQDLKKLGVSRKLFDTCFESRTNNSNISLSKQETEVEKIVENIIASLEKEKCDKTKSEINMKENHISEIPQVHQCESEAINIDGDKNLTVEKIKVSENSNINNKDIVETIQRNSCVTDNIVTSINSDNFITIQDENDEEKDKSDKIDVSSSTILINDILSKTKNNSLAEEFKDSDSHALGLPFSKFVDETLNNKKKLPKLVPNSTVTLKGSPVNDKSQETVIHLQNTPNDSLSIKELLPYKLSTNTDNSELNKPGAKFMRLKEDLKLQMTIKRNEEWKHKEIELREKEEKEKEEWDEEEESDYNSYEQEKIHNLESSDSEESEPEENDICIKDKKRSKCLFADDEAEVTDNEDSSTDMEETYSKNDMAQAKCNKQSSNFKCREEYMDDSESEIETNQEEEEEENVIDSDTNIENKSESDSKDDDNVNVCDNFSIVQNKKDGKTKQFIEEFQDDLNIANSTYPKNDNNHLKYVSIDVNTSETQYEDNGVKNKNNMPVNQQEVTTRNQINKTPSTKTSILDFVSPITQLSVLNTSLDKKDIENKQYLIDRDQKSVFMENTQSDESSECAYNSRNKNILKKKLFDDIKETIDDEYLMRLCSGKFESTQQADLDLFSQATNNKSRLCSENSNTKLINTNQLESLEVEDENSQDVELILDEDSNNSVNHVKNMKQVGEVTSGLKMKIVSSDDDDELEMDTFLKPRKHSVKRLHLSDSEEESVQPSDEENDVDEETEEQYIDYDSEENEVVSKKESNIKQVAADFLEEEAELSESDWDSADEDEKDLDKYEYEEADNEHIDERKMRNQLEKTYMKQMLDEDKREVKLLQELLFEDGDLHTSGMGRERKFKWRNIDKLESNTEMSRATDDIDGWIDVQEDEDEAKWSKLRQERYKFLEERMKCSNNEIEDELCNSQIFKFGLEALKKIKNDESQELNVSHNQVDSSENMEPIMPRNITDLLNGPNTGKKSQTIYNVIKKRSLLTRGEESLAKIASLAKQSDSVSHAINARNFVFQYVNLNNTTEKDNKTREEDQDSQAKLRKRKITSNFSLTTKKRRK
ncbi:Claspin [Camponotus floridanus]|uniref:Claspin n=1 Tax=Camponotus floridanus TaxID=104421 RepID=E2AKY8_CAMFO|nr:Claspin [Camponotus floridanus]